MGSSWGTQNFLLLAAKIEGTRICCTNQLTNLFYHGLHAHIAHMQGCMQTRVPIVERAGICLLFGWLSLRVSIIPQGW